jgi:hypothetical protein
MAWQKVVQLGNDGDTTFWYDPATGQTSNTEPQVSSPIEKALVVGGLTYDSFMAASPQERLQYLTNNQYTQNGTDAATAAAAAVRNITSDPNQAMEILRSSGLDPASASAALGQFGGIVTRQQQDKGDWLTNNGWVIPLAMAGAGYASTLGGGAGAAEAGAAAAESASAGGTVAAGGGGLSSGSLGSGLTLGSSASGLGGGALGTGLTAGSTASGIGGGALGTGIGAGGASLGAAGALAPGFFAAESLYPVLGGGSAATGATGLGSASAGASGASTGASGAASGAAGTINIPGLGNVPISLLGAGLGAASGLLGGAKPAGETTSTTSPWGPLQQYLTQLFPSATNVAQDTLNGKYLTPESNPYLKQYGQFLSDQVGANVDSRFTSAGRYGSGAHTGELTRNIGGTLSGLYGNAYSQERGLQNQTANGLLGGNYGGTQTSPYFNNPIGNMFSGALTGYGLSRMFG